MHALTAHTPGCKTCRTLPPPAPERGTLYLSSPDLSPRAALARYLRDRGIGFDEPLPGVLAVVIAPGLVARLSADLPGALSRPEIDGTRALVVAEGTTPALADLMNTKSLGTLLAGVRHDWLVGVLRDGRLRTYFQPIVAADDPEEVFGYECLTRGVSADGRLVPPDELFGTAREAELLVHLDRQARLTAIESAVRHVPAGHLFINFNPASVYDPAHCLRTTFRAVSDAGLDPGRITFEVVESEEVRDTDHLHRILKVYREAGFGVALDDVGAGYSSLNLLARLRPDFVKFDTGLTRGVDRDPYKARVVGKMLEMARDLGARTVVEGVETVGEWEWARVHGADLVQGYLFARPANPPPPVCAPR